MKIANNICVSVIHNIVHNTYIQIHREFNAFGPTIPKTADCKYYTTIGCRRGVLMKTYFYKKKSDDHVNSC